MFWNKKKKINKEFEDIKDMVMIKRALGSNCVYMPISTHTLDKIKEWCTEQKYHCEVDHIDDDGTMFYKIWGWEY